MTSLGSIGRVVAATLLLACSEDTAGQSTGGGSGGETEGESDAEESTGEAVDPCPESTPAGSWSLMASEGAPASTEHTRGLWVDDGFVALNLVGPGSSARYDPCTAEWTTLAAPPIAELPASPIEVTFARVGTRVFAAMFSLEESSRGFVYDLEANAWSEIDLAGHRWPRSAETFAVGDRVVVASVSGFDDIGVVDVENGSLTVIPIAESLAGRDGFLLGPTDDGLFALGGNSVDGWKADGARLDLSTGAWTSIAAGAPARLEDAVWIDGRLFAWVRIEGTFEGEPMPADPDLGGAFVYDSSTGAWSELALDGGPQPASRIDVVAVDGRVLVFGGIEQPPGGGYQPVGNAAAWDPESGSWSQLAALPDPECTSPLGLDVVGDGMLFGDGCGSFGYDVEADAWIDLAAGNPLPSAHGRAWVHTGDRWIAWGGVVSEVCEDGFGDCTPAVYFSDGAIYRP